MEDQSRFADNAGISAISSCTYASQCLQEQDAEKKLKKGRSASSPPTVSRKEAKRDAVKLERMKPTSGISRKVLYLKVLACMFPFQAHMEVNISHLCVSVLLRSSRHSTT